MELKAGSLKKSIKSMTLARLREKNSIRNERISL